MVAEMTATRKIGDEGANPESRARATDSALSSSGREINSDRPVMSGSRDGVSSRPLLAAGFVHETSRANSIDMQVRMRPNETKLSDRHRERVGLGVKLS